MLTNPSAKYEDIPESFLAEFKSSLAVCLTRSKILLDKGNFITVDDIVSACAIAAQTSHIPFLPVTTLKYAYASLPRLAASFTREAGYYVSPRCSMFNQNIRTVWISKDAFDAHLTSKRMIAIQSKVGASKVDENYRIGIQKLNSFIVR